MEMLIILGVLFIILAPFISLGIATGTGRKVDKLKADLQKLRNEQGQREEHLLGRIRHLELLLNKTTAGVPPSGEAPAATPVVERPPVPVAGPVTLPPPRPLPPLPVQTPPPVPVRPAGEPEVVEPPRPLPPVSAQPAFELEQFMGAKLFAWVGGLALFLGLAFFAKLSIERGWISPELRITVGFVTGLVLAGLGLHFNRQRRFEVLGGTLSATGIVVLYTMTYAAHAFYRLSYFANPLVAFAVMAVITVAAFLMAVRMGAQVVAVLGMLGGFLTPVLCSTGQDNPLGLFGYIALLDAGVMAVARHRRWPHLAIYAAGGTVLLQIAWVAKFFHVEGYAAGMKTWVPVAVYLGFAAFFTFAHAWLLKPRKEEAAGTAKSPGPYPAVAALCLQASAMLAAFHFLQYNTITDRPGLLYGFVLLLNLIAMAGAWANPKLGQTPVIMGLITFFHLAAWTLNFLTPETLPAALGVYLAFGLLHTAHGVLWRRKRSTLAQMDTSGIPVTLLLLMFVPVARLDPVPMLVWPAILLVDLAIIGAAMSSRDLKPVAAAMVLTMVTAGAWVVKLPAESLVAFLGVLGVFAMVFPGAGALLARRVAPGKTGAGELARELPAGSAILSFLLLIMAVLRLAVPDPSQVFGLALLLSLFLLGLAAAANPGILAATALLGVLALEGLWHGLCFDASRPLVPLAWYLGFLALFTIYPHLFRRRFAGVVMPWATAAFAGVGTFAPVYLLVRDAWPNDMMGLLPAAFAVLPLLGLLAVLRLHKGGNPARMAQLAWYGGVSLFFITLIFPLQYKNQWLTVSWACEGAALCWLFRRVPHPALPRVGAALLVVAFVRLALNPAVLTYQTRGATALLNWQLYAYGVTAAACFLGAKWLGPPARVLADFKVSGFLTVLGGTLLFLLLNIEIADFFTPPGSRSLVLEFSGHFARDMTYSIAWGLFALVLLIIGFARRSPRTRYAGIGLLAATLLKLFLHDLANIESAWRISALIVVALIALAASYLYQRFFNRAETGGS